MSPPQMAGKPDLVGWKAIATFLSISVRQAQMYATEAPPPGHNVLPCFDSIWGKCAWGTELASWAKLRLHSHQVGLQLSRLRGSARSDAA